MPKITVIGGALLDIYAYPYQKMRLYDSNPGYLIKAMGGVGRNIAENLVRLGFDVTFLTVVGADADGLEIIRDGQELGIKMITKTYGQTPTYISIMDEHNEDVIGVAATDALSALDANFIEEHIDIIHQSDLVVMDTNMSESTLAYAFERIDRPIYVDAISTHKAIKLRSFLKQITCLKMNLLEAEMLTGITYASPDDLSDLGNHLLAQGLKEAYITLGGKGAIEIRQNHFRHKEALQSNIKNTTGAGDAFFAGVIYAKLQDRDPLVFGLANAMINLQSMHAVSKLLTKARLQSQSKKIKL